MLTINQGKGLNLKFDNGYSISIQIGPGNYCDNYNNDILDHFNKKCSGLIIESNNAEIAIFNEGEWVTGEFIEDSDGMVAGYVSLNEILNIIEILRHKK